MPRIPTRPSYRLLFLSALVASCVGGCIFGAGPEVANNGDNDTGSTEDSGQTDTGMLDTNPTDSGDTTEADTGQMPDAADTSNDTGQPDVADTAEPDVPTDTGPDCSQGCELILEFIDSGGNASELDGVELPLFDQIILQARVVASNTDATVTTCDISWRATETGGPPTLIVEEDNGTFSLFGNSLGTSEVAAEATCEENASSILQSATVEIVYPTALSQAISGGTTVHWWGARSEDSFLTSTPSNGSPVAARWNTVDPSQGIHLAITNPAKAPEIDTTRAMPSISFPPEAALGRRNPDETNNDQSDESITMLASFRLQSAMTNNEFIPLFEHCGSPGNFQYRIQAGPADDALQVVFDGAKVGESIGRKLPAGKTVQVALVYANPDVYVYYDGESVNNDPIMSVDQGDQWRWDSVMRGCKLVTSQQIASVFMVDMLVLDEALSAPQINSLSTMLKPTAAN